MRKALNARITRLEGLMAATAASQAWPPPDGFKRLRERFAAILAKGQDRAHPDPHVRLAYWRRDLADLTLTIQNKGKDPAPGWRNPSVVAPEQMETLRLRFAETCLPQARWHLLEAQLEILARLGHDSPDIQALRLEHGRCTSMPWRWNGASLPCGAEKALEDLQVETCRR